MASFKKFIFFVLLILTYNSVSEANLFKDLKESASLAWEGATGLFDITKYLWSGVENSKVFDRHTSGDSSVDSPIANFTTAEKIQIEQHLKFLKAQGDYLMADIHSVKDVIQDKLVRNVAGLHDLNQGISQILTHVYTIDKSFSTFLDYYTADLNTYDSELVSKFATDIVSSGPCGMAVRLTKIKALVIGNKNLNIQNIVDLLITHAELYSQYANIRQSQHQLLYNLLRTIVITELKAYLTINFSYYLLKHYTGQNYDSFMQLHDKDFKNRIYDTIIAFKSAMQISSKEFYKGDPNNHVEDKTYTQLKNVLQVIALNMIDINRDDRCYNYCDNDAYKKKDFVTNCFDGGICEKQRTCKGNIVNCGYLLKNDLQVCLAPKNSSRRYEFVKDGDDSTKGPNVKCPSDLIDAAATKYYESWYRRCDYCTCLCEENHNSDRFVSLDIVKSRYVENYVITGARFVKKDNTIFIQIQEGKLLPNGVVDPHTVAWVPLPEKPIKVFTLKWGVGREIDLQDLQARRKEALVAVQFKVTGGFRKRLSLDAHTMTIDYLKGKIVDPEKHIKFIYNELPSKQQIQLHEKDLPTRFPEKNIKKSQAPSFLEFTVSGLDTDVGQSLLPFIDLQDITTYPPAPLSGIALYHRSIKNSGGFLAIKLFTYDYEYHLNVDRLLFD